MIISWICGAIVGAVAHVLFHFFHSLMTPDIFLPGEAFGFLVVSIVLFGLILMPVVLVTTIAAFFLPKVRGKLGYIIAVGVAIWASLYVGVDDPKFFPDTHQVVLLVLSSIIAAAAFWRISTRVRSRADLPG